MAVHLPLGNSAILEAQMAHAASQLITSLTLQQTVHLLPLPCRTMVHLVCIHITKGRKGTPEVKVQGEASPASSILLKKLILL
jgi:hypothetical protein